MATGKDAEGNSSAPDKSGASGVISVVKDLQAQPDLRPRVASTLTDDGISSQWIAKSGKGEVLQITPH